MKVDLNSIIIPVTYNNSSYAVVKLFGRAGIGRFSKLDLNTANQMIEFINVAVQNALVVTHGYNDMLRLHDKRAFKLNYFHEYFAQKLCAPEDTKKRSR